MKYLLEMVGIVVILGAINACAGLYRTPQPGAEAVCILFGDAMIESTEQRTAEALSTCRRIKDVSIHEGEVRDSIARSQNGDQSKALLRLKNTVVAAGGNTAVITDWSIRTITTQTGLEVRISAEIYQCSTLSTDGHGVLSISKRTCSNAAF